MSLALICITLPILLKTRFKCSGASQWESQVSGKIYRLSMILPLKKIDQIWWKSIFLKKFLRNIFSLTILCKMLCVCHTPSVWTLLSSMCAGAVTWDSSRCCDHSDPKQTVRVHATDQCIMHTNAGLRNLDMV